MNDNIKENVPKKKHGLSIFVILLGIVLIGTGLFLFFGTDLFKSEKKNNNESQKAESKAADKFVGIYAKDEDKLFIHKTNSGELYYVLGDSFEGTASAKDNIAKQNNSFNKDEYFEFKISDGGIDVSYHAGEDVEVAVATGLYTKVAEYSKENVYKEAVGDVSLLSSGYSGIYKSGDIQLYVYQISTNQVEVSAAGEHSFSKVFDIVSESKLTAKTIFDEEAIAYEINYADNSISLIVNEDVFGVFEEDNELELTYTFEKAITQDDIINNFYSRY